MVGKKEEDPTSKTTKHKTLTFSIEYLQILNEKGKCEESELPKITDEQIIDMYSLMVLSRIFDQKALNLQRQGRMGTYASILGQEAAQVGSAYALQSQDWLFPTFRENASLITRHMPMENLFQYWGGEERGHHYKGLHNFPIAVPISTQDLHATGVAMAAKIMNDNLAVLVHMGDGGTSEGDFHEALNFASVFKSPIVFFCTNNQWAISLPREQQTHSKTIAQKAIAYGMKGIQIDGNDLFAVYKATKDALEHAKKEGPVLIEAVTYRIADHTTADDAKRYRKQKEVDEWKKKDPIKRIKAYLEKKGLWDEKREKALLEESEKKVKDAVQKYESSPQPNPKGMFDFTFESLPPDLEKQKQDLITNYKGRVQDKIEQIEGGFP